MGSWTQAMCQRCWDLFQPGRTPTRLVTPEEEICGVCGEKTKSGIYYRADPKLTPYPRKEKK